MWPCWGCVYRFIPFVGRTATCERSATNGRFVWCEVRTTATGWEDCYGQLCDSGSHVAISWSELFASPQLVGTLAGNGVHSDRAEATTP